jgi:hypothetical protein
MLKVSSKKVKIDNDENGEALGNIEPQKPFHCHRLAGANRSGQVECSFI